MPAARSSRSGELITRFCLPVASAAFRSQWARLNYEVSVAHYGEQNGDAMRDPEITFLVLPSESEWQWTPLTFLNDYVGAYQVAAEYNAEGVIDRSRAVLIKQLATFSKQWDCNLKEQGFVEAYRSRLAR